MNAKLIYTMLLFQLVATQLIQAIGAGLSQTDLAAQASVGPAHYALVPKHPDSILDISQVTHANVASVIALLYLCCKSFPLAASSRAAS